MRRLLAITAIVGLPAIAFGQRLLGVSDLASLSGPPPDHKIQYDAGPLQFGNLRLPKKGGPHPVILFIHGGCWRSQNRARKAGDTQVTLIEAPDSGHFEFVAPNSTTWPLVLQSLRSLLGR